MIDGWHPAIGKAILENWGFSPEMAQGVGNQHDHDYSGGKNPDHTDVIVVGVVLAAALRHRANADEGNDISKIKSFDRLSLTPKECQAVLKHTQLQIGALRAALGC